MIDPSVFSNRVFYATHRKNIPVIMRDGAILAASIRQLPEMIWDREIVDKLHTKDVKLVRHLTFKELVPFTFTPKTPAAMNIATGHRSVARVRNGDICLLTTTPLRLFEHLVPFAVAPMHPSAPETRIAGAWPGLGQVDRQLLASGKFSFTKDDPLRTVRFGAELLALSRVPVEALDECIVWDDVDGMTDVLSSFHVCTHLKVVRDNGCFFAKGA